MPKPILDIKPVTDDVYRKCKVCKKNKQLNTEFYYRSASNCYSGFCKDCHNIRRKLKYAGLPIPSEFDILKQENNKQKKVFQNKPWRKTQFANRKRLDYRKIDKKKGRENDLTIEFINNALNSSCFYCGFRPSGLDRLDQNLGHTIANCVPCCWECNTARNDNFTSEEMKEIGKIIRKIKISRMIV